MRRHPVAITLMFLVSAVAQAASGQETNVALAANGATIRADSEYAGNAGGPATAERLIDGIIRQPGMPAAANRWHSALESVHPHWVWIRFARPATISKVTLHYSDIGAPVDFVGQTTTDGKSVQTLFRKVGAQLDAEHPSLTIGFPPVTTDQFRLLITRSSNKDHPGYTQLSEIQVFGRWAGEPAARAKPLADRRRGELKDRPLPKGLRVETAKDAVIFTSPWLKIAFDLDRPIVRWLSVDGAGNGSHAKNLLKSPQGIDAVAKGWNEEAAAAQASFAVSRSGNVVRYSGIRLGSLETVDIRYTVQPKELHVTIDRHVPADYLTEGSAPLRMLFDLKSALATPMGRLKSPGILLFPCLLHFPDCGTLLVRTSGPESAWAFLGRRAAGEVQLSLQQGCLALPDAVMVQKAGHYRVNMDLSLTSVYPEKALVDADPKLAGVKRAWLNTFGFRPDIATLSNNCVSDNAIFCLYEFADHAYYTPPLFCDFTALDMVRMSLDAYFAGAPSYGRESNVFVDTDPSIIISAWDYATGKPDLPWLRRQIGEIEKYADHIIAADRNGDGLVEAEMSGNSGIGRNGAGDGQSNWWDQVASGWNDAYAIALDYRAFRCAADLERRLGRQEKADDYRRRAERIKAVYYSTFYNPKTGVLAGWRSKDGQLHDYYFTFVNGIAVAYGLLTPEQGNAVMDRMQAKFREVGYKNFRLGIPGNLVPIVRKDYNAGSLGSPKKDDGSDGFGIFENGGTTACFAHFYIQALYTLGRKAEADAIFDAMLEGYRDGAFQNGIGGGGEWRRWDGTPSGYEGLLTDSYYTLSVLITGRLGRGIPIP